MPATTSPVQALFPTLVYRAPLGRGLAPLNRRLRDEIDAMSVDDRAGLRWSAKNYLGGYTSYGSLSKLHQLSSLFGTLEKRLDSHVRRFVRELPYDMRGRDLAMTDCWANVMPAGTVHSLHLHPLSFVSGTYYVDTPPGSAALKLEDPRLSKQMATPPRRANLPAPMKAFVEVPAEAGTVVLFESWLRHEVPPADIEGERVSVSFNYAWSAR